MANIIEIQNEIIEDFSFLDDWKDRYRAIIECGRELPEYPEEYQNDQFLIRECQNRVWLYSFMNEGKVYFLADSEAHIVRGLAALLVKIYSGHAPSDILNTPPEFIHELQLGENLTRNRSNGLVAFVSRIKKYALGFQLLLQNTVPPQGDDSVFSRELLEKYNTSAKIGIEELPLVKLGRE